MAIEIKDIAATRIRPDMVLLRSDPHDQVSMGGSVVNVCAMPSGLVVPVSSEKNDDKFMHETRLFVERWGSAVQGFSRGMRVYLKDHPDILDITSGGVAYKLAPASAIRVRMEIVEVAL